MIKKMLNFILVKYYSFKNDIQVSKTGNISFKAIKIAGKNCRILGDVVITGKVNLGRYTTINGPATRISANLNHVKIGNFCSIASNVVIQEYFHKYDRITSYYINQNLFNKSSQKDIFSKGNIVIEDDVWIGSNSVILSGVTIARGSIIGAGSIVTKDVPKYSIVGGNPAKVIKSRFKEETIVYLESLKWWEWDINKIKKNEELFSLNENDIIKYKIVEG